MDKNIEVTYRLFLPRDDFEKKCMDHGVDMYLAIGRVLDKCRTQIKYSPPADIDRFCEEIQYLLSEFNWGD